ncbi:MAG: hypothetical protein PHY47_05195 [Lachnospiraceae bacterium]|nr:hypothetical protein [Lachnospiraceae bacterium]
MFQDIDVKLMERKFMEELNVISVLLNWIYILLTTFILGTFCVNRFASFMKYQKRICPVTRIIAGIAVTTAYAGYFSLFSGVGVLANLLMLIVCFVFLWIDREYYRLAFQKLLSMKIKKIDMIYTMICVLGILGIAYFCSNTNFMADTGLYHAQNIRWIEEYGAVKGIANLLDRLGYNSSFFSFIALYSMKDIFGQSLHAGQGFIAALICVYAVIGIVRNFNIKHIASNICRVAPFVYTLIILKEIISPTTDYPTVYLIMWMVIESFYQFEEQEYDAFIYILIAIVAVFTVSLKLSAVTMMLIAIWPAYLLIKDKKWKQVGVCITIGLLIFIPYLIRNFIISGWFIYPFAGLDLFTVDWKIPKSTVIADATDIKVYARHVFDRNLISQNIFEWFPTWWEGQSKTEKIYSSAGLVTAIPLFFMVIWDLFIMIKDKSTKKLQLLILNAVMLAGFTFWLFSSPLIRYGYAYILTIPILAAANLSRGNGEKHKKLFCSIAGSTCALAILLVVSYSTYDVMKEDYYLFRAVIQDSSYLLKQKDYPTLDMNSADMNGITIYYPIDAGGPTGYEFFPATNYGENMIYWTNRGDSIRDGFRNNEE